MRPAAAIAGPAGKRAGIFRAAAAFLALAALAGCSQLGMEEPAETLGLPTLLGPSTPPAAEPVAPASAAADSVALPPRAPRDVGPAQVVMGSGRFVNGLPPDPGTAGAVPEGDAVTLDFTDVPIRDVLKAVLGDLLNQSYTVDPEVEGNLTLQSGNPIPRDALIDVLTDALQLNGVGLVLHNGIYLAVPLENAGRQAPLGGSGGFVTQIATPQHVAASDLLQALETVIPATTTVRADPSRNLLLVSGPAQDVRRVLANVEVFDADFMKGMSFALLPLQHGQARAIAADVTRMLQASSPSATKIVRVLPIERMNAVLVASRQPGYIPQVRAWVARFDRGDGESEPRLYVYRVQNGRATHLAGVLRRALGISGRDGQAAEEAQRISDRRDGFGPDGDSGLLSDGAREITPVASTDVETPPDEEAAEEPLGAVDALADYAAGAADRQRRQVLRISADASNNALVIVATPQDYAQIEAALQRLDVTPLQVLIEATVAEVTLTDDFKFGLQYAFQSGNFAGVFAPSVGATNLGGATPGAGGGALSGFPGFGFTNASGGNLLFSTASATVLLQALSSLTTVRVLSSPNLMVLNNGTARLQIGNQVPVSTQSSTSNVSPGAPTVNSINYRDTGVILDVVPRVNAGGLVTLDIFEEVSQAVTTNTSNLNSPTIQQRRVTSSVAVHDGQTIALAGLIENVQNAGESGIPVLKDIPVLGALFGTQADNTRRTELLVLITPRVIRSRGEAEAVTRELRQKVRLIDPVTSGAGR